MSESWKTIQGFEGLYEVSSLGNVRSLNYNGQRGVVRNLTPTVNQGYLTVSLQVAGKSVKYSVHVLVCATFNGPKPFPKAVARHLDGSSTNNEPGNLCWGTQAENLMDRVTHGTHMSGAKHPASKLTEDEVLEIISSPHRPRDLAKQYGVTASTISYIKLGRRWAHLKVPEHTTGQ